MNKEILNQALDALRDFASGWTYIRESYGDLYGVGWDRAQEKGNKAICAIQDTISQTVTELPIVAYRYKENRGNGKFEYNFHLPVFRPGMDSVGSEADIISLDIK